MRVKISEMTKALEELVRDRIFRREPRCLAFGGSDDGIISLEVALQVSIIPRGRFPLHLTADKVVVPYREVKELLGKLVEEGREYIDVEIQHQHVIIDGTRINACCSIEEAPWKCPEYRVELEYERRMDEAMARIEKEMLEESDAYWDDN